MSLRAQVQRRFGARSRSGERGQTGPRDFGFTGDAARDYVHVWPLAIVVINAAHDRNPVAWTRAGSVLRESLPLDWRTGVLVWVLVKTSVDKLSSGKPTPSDLDELSVRYGEPFAAATGLSRVWLRQLLYLVYDYKLEGEVMPAATVEALGLALIGVLEEPEDVHCLWMEFREWYATNRAWVEGYAAHFRDLAAAAGS